MIVDVFEFDEQIGEDVLIAHAVELDEWFRLLPELAQAARSRLNSAGFAYIGGGGGKQGFFIRVLR